MIEIVSSGELRTRLSEKVIEHSRTFNRRRKNVQVWHIVVTVMRLETQKSMSADEKTPKCGRLPISRIVALKALRSYSILENSSANEETFKYCILLKQSRDAEVKNRHFEKVVRHSRTGKKQKQLFC